MNIRKFLEVALAVAALVPSPVQPFITLALPYVTSAETIFGTGTGPEKKAWVLDRVADAVNLYNTKKGITKNTSVLMDAISKFVDSAIALEKAVSLMDTA